MAPKTILVCLTTPEHAETLMKFSVPLARKYNAHLIGLHTLEALLVYPNLAMHVPEPAFAEFNQSQKKDSTIIKEVFDNHTRSETFQSEFRLLRAESVSAADRMVDCSRAADLVIMAHEDRDVDRLDQRHVQTRVIKESGRPVIVVPVDYDGPEVGKKIVLGWSDTREAARAAHDLISIADAGADVTVLRVGKPPKNALNDYKGIDISEMFTRHNLKTTLAHRDAAGNEIADILSRVAFEKGADLIVSGAFGHSRIYDFVIGATTYALLKQTQFPVMFSK